MIDSVSPATLRAVPVASSAPVKGPARAGDVPRSDSVGSDFTTVLSKAITDFSSKLRQAETTSIGGVNGTVAMQDVVERVMSAEQSLHAVIAVRDKVISAYQEISRMAI